MINEIKNEDGLVQKIKSIENPNIFLGNGFNMCLGVNTSYESLWKSIFGKENIKEIINGYEGLLDRLNKCGYNIESQLYEITGPGHCSTLKDVLYNCILQRCKTQYKYNEAIDFLSKFNKFFTTNYDPLLYRFLLQPKYSDSEEDDFYMDLKKNR